jgi:hypothetical protein
MGNAGVLKFSDRFWRACSLLLTAVYQSYPFARPSTHRARTHTHTHNRVIYQGMTVLYNVIHVPAEYKEINLYLI